MTFKEAYLRLQEIHQLLSSAEIIDIEEIINLQQEAKTCYELCQSILKKATEHNQEMSI